MEERFGCLSDGGRLRVPQSRTLMAAGQDDNPVLIGREVWFYEVLGLQTRVESSKNPVARETVACLNLKNIRNFVVAASLVLAVWLGLTFVTKVPSHRYPTLGKENRAKTLSAAVEVTKENLATVPVTR